MESNPSTPEAAGRVKYSRDTERIAWREELGLNVVEIMEHSGVSYPYIGRLERGLILRPTLAELRGVARGYGVTSMCAMLKDMTGPEQDAASRTLSQVPELAGRFAATRYTPAYGAIRQSTLTHDAVYANPLRGCQDA